jgi:transcriptional/translational regulatory protein YebC/TACO1
MIITHIPNGYNSIAEVLRSKEFKAFREKQRTQPSQETKPEAMDTQSLLERFLKKLEIRTSEDI